ncbi:uncharacterized protein LOC142322956 isoform X2 [Lycorma delicatula]|uniref:uncharacterized protein LOC142322956 isoform X2 n=1 Tax=Lycorma delicatula TaxID=130591 RepID=UPI003F51369A
MQADVLIISFIICIGLNDGAYTKMIEFNQSEFVYSELSVDIRESYNYYLRNINRFKSETHGFLKEMYANPSSELKNDPDFINMKDLFRLAILTNENDKNSYNEELFPSLNKVLERIPKTLMIKNKKIFTDKPSLLSGTSTDITVHSRIKELVTSINYNKHPFPQLTVCYNRGTDKTTPGDPGLVSMLRFSLVVGYFCGTKGMDDRYVVCQFYGENLMKENLRIKSNIASRIRTKKELPKIFSKIQDVIQATMKPLIAVSGVCQKENNGKNNEAHIEDTDNGKNENPDDLVCYDSTPNNEEQFQSPIKGEDEEWDKNFDKKMICTLHEDNNTREFKYQDHLEPVVYENFDQQMIYQTLKIIHFKLYFSYVCESGFEITDKEEDRRKFHIFDYVISGYRIKDCQKKCLFGLTYSSHYDPKRHLNEDEYPEMKLAEEQQEK